MGSLAKLSFSSVSAITEKPQQCGTGRVCVVTAGGPHPWIIVNALADHFGDIHVIVEDPERRGAFLARRARLQGRVSVVGQFGTMCLIGVGKALFRRRIARIIASEGLRVKPRASLPIRKIASVNAGDFLRAIDEVRPSVILLAGCRILRPDALAGLPCPVLNYHAGITPRYRGMNGSYWALASGDRVNFGATIHLVDAGIDTGAIVAQVRGEPAPNDNIMTYAYRLAAMSRRMCVDTIEDALADRLKPRQLEGESRQWFHPTIWSYLWTGVAKGVW